MSANASLTETGWSVPASTSNLGPGFDGLGIAMDLRNELRVSIADGAPGELVEHITDGPEAAMLYVGDGLLARAVEVGWRIVSDEPAPAIRVKQLVRVPPSRGLGSSSTAIVGGILSGWSLALKRRGEEAAWPPPPDVLRAAVQMEGHPDNSLPCLLGGLIAGAWDGDAKKLVYAPIPTHPDWRMIAAIPPTPQSTKQARAVLPDKYTRADAVFNLVRTPLVVEAFRAGDVELLREAVRDKIHQPYRRASMPCYDIVEAFAANVELPFHLSGSGSTLAVWCMAHEAEAVAAGLRKALAESQFDANVVALTISRRGARRL